MKPLIYKDLLVLLHRDTHYSSCGLAGTSLTMIEALGRICKYYLKNSEI